MPPQNLIPVVIEPADLNGRKAQPDRGHFLLYDSDFVVEKNPKYAVAPGTPPLRLPHFSVGEVAYIAFAGDLEWLKRQLKGKPYKVAANQTKSWPLLLNGELLEFRSVHRGGITSPKRYTLPDIERLAWALFERGDIDGVEVQRISQIILAIAQQYWAHTPEEHS